MKPLDPTLKATIHEQCYIIVKEAPSPIAKTYANACLRGEVTRAASIYGQTEAKAYDMQINYIFCNVANWRGETARNVKSILKGIQKQLK